MLAGNIVGTITSKDISRETDNCSYSHFGRRHRPARACLCALIALALTFFVLAQSTQAQQQKPPPLQGGISQNVQQQPTPDTYNSQSGPYACADAAECFQVMMDDTQKAIERAMSTRTPAWRDGASCSQNPVWRKLDPKSCWQYLVKARKLAEQNESSNTYGLQQQAQVALNQAHQCFDPIYRQWGELGGSYNDQNWNCGEGPAPTQPPPTGQPNTKPPSSSIGSGTSCGKWTSAIVQSCPGGGPSTHGALPGTGGIVGEACIECNWRDANGTPAVHPQTISAPGFIQSSSDPPGAALKECRDKLTPGWVASGDFLCPLGQATGGGSGGAGGQNAGANPPYLISGRYDVAEGTMQGGGSNRPDRYSGWASISILGPNKYQLTLPHGSAVLNYYGVGKDGMHIYSYVSAANNKLYIKFNRLQAALPYYDVVWIGFGPNGSNRVETWQWQQQLR